ncbi:MAG TPA: 16S rRNA (cytosine(1402)-N(4))-methyltransferase [Nitrospiraceae bacterium]|nr:16S rRNA (cytosine(1402)-N(4))-methyltransferase [Nitrospiraceae bacterium]
MSLEFIHTPVLLEETMEMLDIRENGTYVDATVGLGGHAAAVLSRLGSSGRLVGIDRDENALGYARQRLGNNRVALKKGSFSGLQDILLSLDIHKVDGILFDLGVSMMQLKGMERGFSFLSDSRLDMRMDTEQELTAWDIVNKYPEKEMERILREYGEDPYAKRTAKTIVFNRMKKKIDTCRELADIISKACGRRGKIHPATRAFQALRIEVNREMDELKNGLASAVNMLTSDGRLCVISYHSLEDRIVKNFIRESAREGVLKILTKKPLTPAYEEVRRNPSSRSAKLRGAEKL